MNKNQIHNPECKPKKAYLRKLKKEKFNECELIFKESDILKVDHLLPRKLGGRKNRENLQLLHKHCPNKQTNITGELSR
jgi:RNA-directed DNA polymerase